METATIVGVLTVVVAGLMMGSVAWPIKLMRKLQYEHWAFVAMLVGLVIIPWLITLSLCPNAISAYKTIAPAVLIKSNLFSLSWGIANVLGLICTVRIGFSLTNGILAGIGSSVGVVTPMIFKASGLFKSAPPLSSRAGITVLCGAAIMLFGVVLVSLAGFGRDKEHQKIQERKGSFLVSLIMIVLAGILSCGISFAFVYSQGPIVEAMRIQGASDIPANFAVWTVGLMGGALINILYPAYLMTRKKSWHVLFENVKEIPLAVIIGLSFCISVALMGKGMITLGVLGASIGFGIQQIMQILGSQGVGFISGEWRGITGKPLKLIYWAIFILVIAAVIMSYGNTLNSGN